MKKYLITESKRSFLASKFYIWSNIIRKYRSVTYLHRPVKYSREKCWYFETSLLEKNSNLRVWAYVYSLFQRATSSQIGRQSSYANERLTET